MHDLDCVLKVSLYADLMTRGAAHGIPTFVVFASPEIVAPMIGLFAASQIE